MITPELNWTDMTRVVGLGPLFGSSSLAWFRFIHTHPDPIPFLLKVQSFHFPCLPLNFNSSSTTSQPIAIPIPTRWMSYGGSTVVGSFLAMVWLGVAWLGLASWMAWELNEEKREWCVKLGMDGEEEEMRMRMTCMHWKEVELAGEIAKSEKKWKVSERRSWVKVKAGADRHQNLTSFR